MMNWEQIGPARIFRPGIAAEVEMRERAEAHFRSRMEPGVYRDVADITSAFNHQFAFFQGVIDDILPSLASVHFNEFVLAQYDESTEANEAHKAGRLTPSAAERWTHLGPVLRRGLKFLCERVVLLQPPQATAVPDAEIVPLMDRLWVAMEEGTRAYLLSDQTHGVYEGETTLTVFAPGADERYLDLSVDRPYDFFGTAVRRDRDHKGMLVGSPGDVPLFDNALRAAHLDGPLQETIGATYGQAIGVLANVMERSRPPDEGFQVLYLRRADVVRTASGVAGLEASVVERVLDGFTVTPGGLLSEGRELFKPKQEHRAFRRGFLLMPHESGPHLAFSRSMAREAFVQLVQGFAFQKAPEEWMSNEVKAGLMAISNVGGTWFEGVVAERLGERGFVGKSSLKVVGHGDTRLRVPGDVGEIDYLGYLPGEQLLLIGEAKLVQESAEPRLMRDDLTDFVRGRRPYADKLRRKAAWVRGNLDAVSAALATDVGQTVEPLRMAVALVTFTPTVAAHFIDDFPCVSLTNLLLDLDAVGGWPYDVGAADV